MQCLLAVAAATAVVVNVVVVVVVRFLLVSPLATNTVSPSPYVRLLLPPSPLCLTLFSSKP